MIVPLTFDDALYVCTNMRESDWREVQALTWHESRAEFAYERFKCSGVAFSVCHHSEPALIGGVMETTPNTMACWLLGTEEFTAVALHAWRFAAKRLIPSVFRNGVTRVESLVQEGNELGIRYAERFGFEREGLRRRLGRNGENYIQYGMVA